MHQWKIKDLFINKNLAAFYILPTWSMKVYLLIDENMLEFRVYGYLFIQDYIMSNRNTLKVINYKCRPRKNKQDFVHDSLNLHMMIIISSDELKIKLKQDTRSKYILVYI